MANTYQIGRIGRIYAAKESAYGTAATLVAGDAIRHLNHKFNDNPRNRVNSPERHIHPSQLYRFTRRRTADWMLGGIFYPSGTINTLPDHDPILETAFGSVGNVTLSTTVSGAPSPTSTVFTLASVTGLVVGGGLLVNATTGGRQVRVITNISGSEVTVAPALQAAPTAGDTAKGCIAYKLTTALASSLNMASYLTSKSYEVKGCAPNILKLMFDANEECRWEASGPAQRRIRPAQTDPTTFTTVGTTPPSGLTGYLRVDAAAEEFLKATFEIRNGIELDNVAFGTSEAQAMYRAKKREVLVTVDAMDSSDVTIQDNADNTSDQVLMLQCGLTEGSIIGVYCPKVELEVPDDVDSEETQQHSFKGVAKGSAAAGNDEITLLVA